MNLQTFDFNEAPVRVMLRDEQPWFVAADVCRVLDIQNPTDAVKGLDEDETITLANSEGNPRAGIPHQLRLVSESGLYALVFKSRKAEAKKFRKWVTAEVLPALRQTGRYELPADTCASRRRTVRDDMKALRELLLLSASAVHTKTLDVGRAQQLANLAGRFLETIKMEGDAIGYETLFEMPAGEGGGGLLPHGSGHPGKHLQEVPQHSLHGAQEEQPGIPAAPVCREETLGAAEPAAGEDTPETLPRAADLGPATNGSAAAVPGARSSPVGAS